MAEDVSAARLVRLVRLSLGFNVALLLVNGAMFYFLVILVVDEPATVEGVSAAATSAADATAQTDPREDMRTFFKEKSQMLDRAARRHGTNPADVVPTKEEVEAAVESRTMRSAESELVLQKLREGFDYYNLTWPVALPNY